MKKVFDQMDTWAAMRAAEEWLDSLGYSYGPTDRTHKRGILRGDYIIAKFHNLTKTEITQLDGIMWGDNRNGPITVEIYERS